MCMEKNIYFEIKQENDRLKATVKKQKEILERFGYPKVNPQPVADAKHWKEKYKRLMEEKIRIERERNKLYECAEKLIREINKNGIQVNLKDYEKIKGPSGISLIPGAGQESDLNYKPFKNKF